MTPGKILADIDEFVSFAKKQDIDPNAAIIMLALNKNGWSGRGGLNLITEAILGKK